MRLFILAAGTGSRLMPLTKNTPKSLLDLGDGTTLLERQLNNAIESGIIDDIIILTGYKKEQIEAKIVEYKGRIKIRTIYNPFYENSNNLFSLYFAYTFMLQKDFLITNGDNIYQQGIYQRINEGSPEEGITITIDYRDEYDDDDMKVTFLEDKLVKKVHKEIPLDKTDAESVGLAIVKGKRSRKLFKKKVIQMIKDEANINKYWLVVFNELVKEGIPINTVEIDQSEWREMDFHPDLKNLRELVFKDVI
ncbi:MAG: sugar phosphate nucleotidyltransferase [Cyclobacteriaceae bacterium]